MKKIILLLLLTASICGKAQTVTTIAGNGTSTMLSGDGFPATSSGLHCTPCPAIDKYGNLFFFDCNYLLRKLDTAGIVTTIAGFDTAGYSGDGGPATAARVCWGEVTADNAGNIYFSDATYYHIRKIDRYGIITTIAGDGTRGYGGDGGPATAAQFNGILDLYSDNSGNIYVIDFQKIRKIDASGIITTVAGTGVSGRSGDGGPATAATLSDPNMVAKDHAGNLYITDGNSIRKVDASGIISSYLPYKSPASDGGDGGPATAATFWDIYGMCLDDKDNIYVSSLYGGRIRKIDASTGIVTTYAGSALGFADGPATTAQFGIYVTFLAMDCGNNMFVGDAENIRLRKITVAHNPYYVGEKNILFVCENSSGNICDSMLKGENPAGVGETLEWMLGEAPKHGSVSGLSYSTSVVPGTIMPKGITYTPTPGYTGPDSFTVDLDCTQIGKTRTIYVTVQPLPGVNVIMGADTLCKGGKTVFTNATTGGVWSSGGTAIGVSGSTISGLAAGTAVLSYTVNDGFCSNSATKTIEVVNCPTSVKKPGTEEPVTVYPNPVHSELHIDNIAAACDYRLLSVLGSIVLTGTLERDNNVVDIKRVPAGIYILETSGRKFRIIKE